MARRGAPLVLAPAALPGLVLLGLAACAPAPIPLAQAETICAAEAQNAAAPPAGPRTRVGFGIGSGGHRSGFMSVEMSGDQLTRSDPAQVFDNCVRRRSGQPPSRPLHEQPGWRVH